MNELQINSKDKLIDTLKSLASQEKQMDYKKSVPYVHIPYELICQWDGHFVKNQNWFREIWTDYQWKELNDFDEKLNHICKEIPNNDFPDVPEVFKHPLWIKLKNLSKKILSIIENGPTKS